MIICSISGCVISVYHSGKSLLSSLHGISIVEWRSGRTLRPEIILHTRTEVSVPEVRSADQVRDNSQQLRTTKNALVYVHLAVPPVKITNMLVRLNISISILSARLSVAIFIVDEAEVLVCDPRSRKLTYEARIDVGEVGFHLAGFFM